MNLHPSFRRAWWHLIRPALLVFGILGLSLTAVLAQGTGSISGTVISATTRNGLQGASVRIPALNIAEITDNTGAFLLNNVPVGPVQLVIGYADFEEQRRTVTVTTGPAAPVMVELKPADIIMMEVFTVASEREGAALSITEQRNAANIKNVTALDEWGSLPTLNVAEVAMRLPGISFTTDEDNVPNNVSIRGMSTDFTRLNVDGMSSTGVGGNGRGATLHSFNAALYEQIEIIAAQTPDKRADGLGGQLNLKTRSPLSVSDKRRIGYNVSARVAPPFAYRIPQRESHANHPIVNMSYIERFDAFGGSHNLGIAFSFGYSETVGQMATDQLLYQGTTNPVAYFNDYMSTTGLNLRSNMSANLRADYQLSPRTRITLSFMYNTGRESFYDRTRVNAWSASSLATINPTTGQLSTTGAVMPGFTKDRAEIRPIAASRMDLTMWRYSFLSQNPTGTIGAEHKFGRTNIDYALRWSNTRWHSGSGTNRDGGQLTMRAEPIGFVLDKSDLEGRVFTQLSGPSVYDPASYTSNLVFTQRDTVNRTNEITGNINLTYAMPTEIPIQFKTGLDTQNRRVNSKQESARRWNRTAGAPPLTGDLMTLTRFEQQHGGQRLPVFDPVAIYHTQINNAALWTEDLAYAAEQPYSGRRIMEEGVDSGYVMGTARLGGLTLVGGVRAEHVELDTFTFARYKTTSAAVEPDPVKRMAMDYGAATSEGRYTKYFPSLVGSYNLSPNLKARLSWAMTYGRPTLAQLVPAITANDQAETVTAGNPSIKPQQAENVDFKLEYYWAKNTGMASAGLFTKKITDYILNGVIGIVPEGPDNGFEGHYGGYTLTAPRNYGSAEVTGLEFEYRQRLSFLPGVLKGLSFWGNYTILATQGKFTGTVDRGTYQVTGFVPKSANARLLYTYRNLSASTGLNFTGRYPVSYSSTTYASYYRNDLTTFDCSLSYKFRPEATFMVSVSNLTEKGPSQYTYIPDRIRTRTLAGMTFNIGVQGSF